MKQTGYDMLYLTACAVNNITPDSSCIALIDPDELFKMCQYHSCLLYTSPSPRDCS